MASFSVPADFKASTIEAFERQNKSWAFPVREVYGSLNPSIFGSGRHGAVLKPLKFTDLQRYIESCKSNGIGFNYVLNFNCASNMEYTPKGKKKITTFIQKLNSIGVDRFTVVLPTMIELINKAAPQAKVGVSVISDVDSLTRLRAFMQTGNVDRVCFA